ncbi:uncharacterized protein TRIADDRAFT_31903 [Trichoplax adhaerens]|uniref:Uncharacterized protein n=1 Tax=Trichoplax adhaerens TaxID=10228 RepID=B3SA54_TRIAD|nr:hypothetical protein TRIADDRAFT_31903 [Trichoplax adhaerens]EDV20374.1 hypothetical protein TRIADDRAFT_31903 [Trichoplax adhaerens]|eukprot:XP_002117068.1 hypothetical protein TRIADDRAFT_31903 [Trichoplax adhaerens]
MALDRKRNARKLKWIFCSASIFTITVTIALIIDAVVNPRRHLHAAVASDHPACTAIGLETLKNGGSAVDSAISTLICLGVVNMQYSGIGGGGFMLARLSGKYNVINFREVAPAASSTDMFHGNATLARMGGLSVGVPGELRGFDLAHQKYGKLPWKNLIMPSVTLARHGFKVTAGQAKFYQQHSNLIKSNPQLKQLFIKNGNLPKEGDIVKRSKLAETLQRIAIGGADVFYSGTLAKSIVSTVQSNGGILTLADLKNYKAKIQEPISYTYHGNTLVTTPAPSGGPVVMSILNILEGYNFTANVSDTVLSYHRIIEAFKFAYAQRTKLGDPNFVSDVNNFTKYMLSKNVGEELREKISDYQTFNVSYYGAQSDVQNTYGTTHVSILTSHGDAVSVTSTVNWYFGSGLITPTGIVLNNQMDDFSSPNITNGFGVEPSKANYVKPGKQPLSSISPVLHLHRKYACKENLAVGASGGTMIITGVSQVLLDLLSFKQNISSAIERPRLHDQLLPDAVEVETNFPKSIITGLEKLGHNVKDSASKSVVNGVSEFDRKFLAHADSRKGGTGATF